MNKALRLGVVLIIVWVASISFAPAKAITGRTDRLPGQVGQQPNRSGFAQEQATATPENTTTPLATATTVESPTIQPTNPPTQTLQPSETPTPAELTVLRVEPERLSRESGGTLSIYGSGFGPGIAVRLVGYGLLDAAVINPTAIRAVVPPGLSEGRYGVEVIQSDGSSVHVENAVRIRSSQPDPTETPTPGPFLAIARPELVIQSVRSDPDPISPQGAFSLSLEVINRGDYTATNVRLALASTDIAVPMEGSNLVVLESLDPDQIETMVLTLVLSETASSGRISLPFSLEYSDYYLRDYASEQTIGLNVSDSAASQPLVLLSAYETQPSSLSPGDAFTLHLQLANVGGNDAGQLLVTMGSMEGGDTRPFALLGTGNVRYVEALEAGKSVDLEMQIMLDGAAESGVYNLPVSIEYEGEGSGTRQSENQMLNLLVSRRPNLRIDYFESPGMGQVGKPLELPIEVVNIGRELVNVSTIQVSGEGLRVEEGSAFIGALDAGTSGSIDARVVPEQSGKISVVVSVDYLDDFNQPQTVSQTLGLDVEQPAPTPQSPGGGESEAPAGLWSRIVRILRGLFGLGS